jgi:hypothetical protein
MKGDQPSPDRIVQMSGYIGWIHAQNTRHFSGWQGFFPQETHDFTQCQFIDYQFIKQVFKIIAVEIGVISLFRSNRHPEPFPFHHLDIGNKGGDGIYIELQFFLTLSLAGSERPELFDSGAKIIHDFGETDTFSGRYPFEPQAFGIYPDLMEKLHAHVMHSQRIVISLRVVVAIIEMAAAYENSVSAFFKGPEYELQVDSAGTHDPDNPEIGGVLKTGHAAEIGASITTPVAQESDDIGFEFRSIGHLIYLIVRGFRVIVYSGFWLSGIAASI